jgi:hypothetical protein
MSTRTGWKGALLVILSLAILGLVTCGGGSGAATSGLAKRAFVSDDVDGTLHIEDAQKDIESFSRISTGAQPGTMKLSPDKSITLVFNAGSSTLAVVTNATESVPGSITLPALSTDYVAMSNNTVGFATVPNSSITPCIPRCVEVLNVATTFNVTGTINTALNPATMASVPLNAATTLALSPDGNKLLVFGAPGDHVDTLTFIDTNIAQTTPTSAATQLGPDPALYSRPLSAVFTSDSSKAFVFNCGTECGLAAPAAASVTVLDVTKSPPVKIANIPVAGATIGLLNGSTLYVAGSPPGTDCTASTTPTSATSCGTLQTIDTGTLTPSAPVIITDGLHDHMELGSNSQLFIGARICTNVSTASETRGCLTIFGTTTNKVVVPPVNFDVTGIAPISNRNIVYVVQGGELRIFDTTTDALTPTQIDVVGKAVDVKYVDK